MKSRCNCLLIVVLVLAGFGSPVSSWASAIVTVNTPTSLHTNAYATPGGIQDPKNWSNGTDTGPFDETLNSRVSTGVSAGQAEVHFALAVTAEEIRTTFDGTCSAGGQFFPANARYSASFSLDIVVDTETPFFFEVRTATSAYSVGFIVGSALTYRLFTPNGPGLNATVTASGNTKSGGGFAGVFLPGETYRLEFSGGAEAASSNIASNAAGSGSAVLVIPEPGSIEILCLGVICLCGRMASRDRSSPSGP